MELASPTQIESHFVEQQNESWAQSSVTQVSQPDLSFAPVVHSECAQVEPPPPPLPLPPPVPPPPAPPPPQVSPQIDETSPRQIESHAVEQQ